MIDLVNETANEPVRILLVDDDTDMIRLIARELTKHFGSKAWVTGTADPIEAEEAISNRQAEIVITDLDMVDTNGFHLLKRVKEMAPLTQVIVYTGHNSANAVRSAFQMGADEYITKSSDLSELTNSLKYLMGRLHRLDSCIADLNRRSVVQA